MTNVKVSEITTTNSTLASEDLFYTVDDPSGTPTGAKTTFGQLEENLNVMVPTFSRNTNWAESTKTVFPSGHGYTKTGTYGTITDDTTDYVCGSQSLQLDTDGAAGICHFTKTSISPTYDFSASYVTLTLKVSNPSALSELWLYLSSDNLSSAYYAFKLTDDISQLKADTWTTLTLSFGEATTTGSPDRSAINCVRFRATDDASEAVTININKIGSFSEASSGYVSIVFDDGRDSTFTQGKKKMSEYGFAGTAYIIPDYIGETNYMTLANLKELQNVHGWDISAHHQTNLTTLSTEADVEQTIIGVKKYLYDNGFHKGANHFAYPNGAYDETTVLPVIRRYFNTARTISDYAETLPPYDPHKLRVMLVINTTTTSAISTAVTRAINNKEWLILVFHQIVTTADDSTEYSITNFGTVIDNLASSGATVLPVSAVYNKLA